jgi:streptogramin lyase
MMLLAIGCGGGGGGAPESPGAKGGALWIMNGELHQVARMDGATGEKNSVHLDEQPSNLAVGGAGVWLTTIDGSIVRVDPNTMTVSATLKAGPAPVGIAVSDDAVWVADAGNGTGEIVPKIYRIDPATNGVVTSFEVEGVTDHYGTMLFAMGDLYLEIDNNYGVARIDTDTNQVTEFLPLGKQGGYGYGELAFDGSTLWTADQYSSRLHALTPAPVAPKNEFAIEERFDGSMAVGAGYVFLEDTDGEKIGAFDAGGALHYELSPGGSVRWLTHKQGQLIVALTDTSGGDLTFFDAGGKVVRTLPAVYADQVVAE